MEKKVKKSIEKKIKKIENKEYYSLNDEQRIDDIKVPLFHHQETSILNMEERERTQFVKVGDCKIETNISILGDMPGYGKTRSLCGLIYRDRMEWDIKKSFVKDQVMEVRYDSNCIVKMSTEFKRINSTLCVVSSSILDQWIKESRLFGLRVKTVTKKSDFEFDPNKYQLILIITTMYNKFIEQYQNVVWKRFCYDEPASTHIPAMKSIKFGFGWFVTATPYPLLTVKGQKHFVKYMFNGMSDFLFHAITIKNDDEYVRASFEMPPTKIIEYDCINPGVISVVQDIISPEIITMITAGNIQGAIKSLGGDSSNRDIIKLVTENKNNKLNKARTKIKEYTDRKDDKGIKKWKDRELKIMKEIETIKDRFKNILKDPCAICFLVFSNPVMVPCCQNILCGSCILEWLKNHDNCPLCRQIILANNLITIKHGEDKMEDKGEIKKITGKTKLNTLLDIIKEHKKNKFIIVSNYDETFTPIRLALIDNDFKFVELKGGITVREKNIKAYKEGNINIIFLNSKFNGSGLNLENTDNIIFYHQLTPNQEKQVIGRTKRIGSSKTLTIHKLN